VEAVVTLLGFLVTVLGLLLAWRSRTDRLLTEIRDVLVDIRNDARRL